MPLVTPTVWTLRRKWLGNLVPALFWFPLSAFGIAWMAIQGQIVGLGLWSLVSATALGWLAVNQFGLFENKRMRRQLARILEAKHVSIRDAPFVGIATPRFSSMLDPHEDVGFLCFHPDRLSFASETRTIDVPKASIAKVRFRVNVHTVIGLGGWISVEGVTDGRPIRLLIEPRERQSLLSNLRYSKKLAQRIRRWVSEP